MFPTILTGSSDKISPRADFMQPNPLRAFCKSVIDILMRVFSDFRIFERPPKTAVRLFRWIAWRWLALGFLFTGFVLALAASHFIGGEPIYYINENRNLTDAEAWNMILMFLSGGGFFFLIGLLGVLYLPKR